MSGRGPLLNTAADQRLFVADESRSRALAAMQSPRNVLISGEPGSGKSSLLFRVLFQARRRNAPALIVDGRLADGSRALVDLLLALAVDEGWVAQAPTPASNDPLGPARQLRRLREAPPDAVALVDDLTISQALSLFGQYRDELWQTSVHFAAAVSPAVAQALSQPPADAFFDERVQLDPFGGENALEVRRRRAARGEASLIAVEPEAALQPRALIALAEGEAPAGRYDPARQHRMLELAENAAGRPGAMLLAEMWGRDGVSASDTHLQHSLGVTRNRLTELLRALEACGVLSSYIERREGRTGRPRVIYTVRSNE